MFKLFRPLNVVLLYLKVLVVHTRPVNGTKKLKNYLFKFLRKESENIIEINYAYFEVVNSILEQNVSSTISVHGIGIF